MAVVFISLRLIHAASMSTDLNVNVSLRTNAAHPATDIVVIIFFFPQYEPTGTATHGPVYGFDVVVA